MEQDRKPLADHRMGLSVTAHQQVEFVQFLSSGAELLCNGYVWSQAPSIGGMKCFWVLASPWQARDVPEADRTNLAVAVAQAARRHRVGIVQNVRGRATWIPKRGRYVDKGDLYSEEHSASPTGALTFNGWFPGPPPMKIEVPPLDPVTFALLSGEADPGLLQ